METVVTTDRGVEGDIEQGIAEVELALDSIRVSGFAPKTIRLIESSGIFEAVAWPLWLTFRDTTNIDVLRDGLISYRNSKAKKQTSPVCDTNPEFREAASVVRVVTLLCIIINQKFIERLPVWPVILGEHQDDLSRSKKLELAFEALTAVACQMCIGACHLNYGTETLNATDAFLLPREVLEDREVVTCRELSLILAFMSRLCLSLDVSCSRSLSLRFCGLTTLKHVPATLIPGVMAERPSVRRLWPRISDGFMQLSKVIREEVEEQNAANRSSLMKFREYVSPSKSLMTLIMSDFLMGVMNLCLCMANSKKNLAYEPAAYSRMADSGEQAEDIDEKRRLCLDTFAVIERSLDLLIDVLAQLPTRRTGRPFLSCKQLGCHLRTSLAFTHPEGELFRQLISIYEYFANFEVDDESGERLSRQQLVGIKFAHLASFQRVLFKSKVKDCRRIVCEPISRLETPELLREVLSPLDLEVLCKLVEVFGLSVTDQLTMFRNFSQPNQAMEDREFLINLLLYSMKARPNLLDEINQTPFFPTEEVLWHPNLSIPEDAEVPSLPVPKINLQFLTLYDLLTRHYNLFVLESAFQIRCDLEDAIRMMRPHKGTTQFSCNFDGQCRMAMPIETFSVMSVLSGRADSEYPSSVRGEVVIDLRNARDQRVRDEWDGLRSREVLFMVSIAPPAELSDMATASRQIITSDFCSTFGIIAVRGCELSAILNEEGVDITDGNFERNYQHQKDSSIAGGSKRTLRVELDPIKFTSDLALSREGGSYSTLYGSFNLLIRRKPEANNFKGVVGALRAMLNTPEKLALPAWIHDTLLGFGNPSVVAAPQENQLGTIEIDAVDTFVNREHLKAALNVDDTQIEEESSSHHPSAPENFRIVMDASTGAVLRVHPYSSALPLRKSSRRNDVPFTPLQVKTILGIMARPGLSVVVGPPGTGKTDTAVQAVNLLLRAYPNEKILLIAHSNEALNAFFAKVARLDIDERYLLRLGMGEKQLKISQGQLDSTHDEMTRKDFSKQGRVRLMLEIRSDLLARVAALRRSMCLAEEPNFNENCLSAAEFMKWFVFDRIRIYNDMVSQALGMFEVEGRKITSEEDRELVAKAVLSSAADLGWWETMLYAAPVIRILRAIETSKDPSTENNLEAAQEMPANANPAKLQDPSEIMELLRTGQMTFTELLFPFHAFFSNVPDLFVRGQTEAGALESVRKCFDYMRGFVDQLLECRPFESIRTIGTRTDHMISTHAKVVAMTCTHAALVRQQLIEIGFKYDTLIMEETGQVLEIEALIPMLLGTDVEGHNPLKRVVLLGDHTQLPPVVQHRVIQNYSNLDQSLFARLIRLNVPHYTLDSQGRCRPSLLELFRWAYEDKVKIVNLPHVMSGEFLFANAGLAFEYQLIDVPDGKERSPQPHFHQNLAEAEYIIALFMYLRLRKYPASKITVLATYNGQKQLLKELFGRKCGWNPMLGYPNKITTVDKYQGQQNDIVLLSLVRTESTVGHIRDIRRLIVAVSRARLGLYVFCKLSLFNRCREIQHVLTLMKQRPTKLALIEGEFYGQDTRLLSEPRNSMLIQNSDQLLAIVKAESQAAVKAT